MSKRGPEEGHRCWSPMAEPTTGGRGNQMGRERQARDGAVAALVRIGGHCALQGGRGGGWASEREGRWGGKGGRLADRRGGGPGTGHRCQVLAGVVATGT
jgi:hypothetical protein